MKPKVNSPVGVLRRCGLRVSMGPWTVYVTSSAKPDGRLIVALGRTAGGAVTRSRVRRLARGVFGSLNTARCVVDILLLARDEVSRKPRRNVRTELLKLMQRGKEAVAQQSASVGRKR